MCLRDYVADIAVRAQTTAESFAEWRRAMRRIDECLASLDECMTRGCDRDHHADGCGTPAFLERLDREIQEMRVDTFSREPWRPRWMWM